MDERDLNLRDGDPQAKAAPVTAPRPKGFGSEMLERTLACDLKAKTALTFNSHGLHRMIAVPLNRRVVHTPAVGA